jgi:hypothetical protein
VIASSARSAPRQVIVADDRWLVHALRMGRVAAALSILWIIALAIVFALRIGFPLELEWMEGGVLHQAHRFMHGEPIYPPPSEAFVPFLYTPLYAITLGTLGHVFGLGYGLGRAVSIIAWIAIGLAMHRAVTREGKSKIHALVAVGLWCSGYVFAFRWVDLARPDTMFLALAIWALVLLRESWGDWKKAALAGLLMALAFWTKQTAAILIIASGIGALVVAPRQLWAYVVVIGVVDGLGMLLFDGRTGGMLWMYVFELHQAHAFNDERFWKKTWGMFVHAAPWLTVLVLWLVASFVAPWLLRKRKLGGREEDRLRTRLAAHRGLAFWTVMATAGALVSALGYSTQWAEPNAFLPGVCLAAVWIGVAIPRGGRDEAIALGLVSAQLVFALVVEPRYQPIQSHGISAIGKSYAWQDLSRTIPSAAQREAAATLRAHLESDKPVVFALHRPWWSVLAGGDGHVGSMGVTDVAVEDRKRIEQAIAAQVKDVAFDEMWFEGEPPAWLRPSLRGRYKVVERLQGDARVRPLSGWMSDAGMVTEYTADQIRMAPITATLVPAGVRIVADFEDGTLQGVGAHGGFGRRPVSGFTGDLPQPAAFGGEFWLSSAGASGRIEVTGDAKVGPIAVQQGSVIVARVAAIGRRTKLAVAIEDGAGGQLATLALPESSAVFAEVAWTADVSADVFLRVSDDDTAGAIMLDDVWLR